MCPSRGRGSAPQGAILQRYLGKACSFAPAPTKGLSPFGSAIQGDERGKPLSGRGIEPRATSTSELAELFASHETFLDDFQRHALGFRHEEEGQQDERGVQTGKEPESA